MTLPVAVVCPACGADGVEAVRERRAVTADDGTALEFEEEFSRCRACGVEHYTREQSLAASRARATVLRAHEGLLSPPEIRSIRERLGYTQAELEQAMGVGAKTVVRWEKGTVRQSRLADRFLRALAAHPNIVYDTAVTGAVIVPNATVYTGFTYMTAPAVGGAGVPVEASAFIPGVNVYASSTYTFLSAATLHAQTHVQWAGVGHVGEDASWELAAANSELAEAA